MAKFQDAFPGLRTLFIPEGEDNAPQEDKEVAAKRAQESAGKLRGAVETAIRRVAEREAMQAQVAADRAKVERRRARERQRRIERHREEMAVLRALRAKLTAAPKAAQRPTATQFETLAEIDFRKMLGNLVP